jgi:hypothetical protein
MSCGGIAKTTSSRSDECGDVVAFERVDIPCQQLLMLRINGRIELLDRHRCDRGPSPLQCTVDRSHAGFEQLGHFGGLPAQHLAQDERGALLGREVLQRGHERQADRFALGRDHGWIPVEIDDPFVGDRLDPRVLGPGRENCVRGRRRRPQLHRPSAPLRAAVHVDADIVGDAIEPGAQR